MKKLFIILPVIFGILLSGCWDKKELNEVALVIGVGLDKVEDESYKITAQVIKPSSGQDKAGGSELPTWSISATGKTVMSAIRNLNESSPRRLYWAHLQIIIFGEELARESLSPIITWFERDRDSRAGSYLIVTNGLAEDLLNQKIELGNVPAKSMAELLKASTIRQINAREVKLRDIMNTLSTPGVDPVLDVINPREVRGKIETYELDGVAVFNKDKLMGFINGKHAIGTEAVSNELNFSILDGKCPANEGFFSFQITDYTSTKKPLLKNEKIIYRIKIALEGNLTDQTCQIDLLKPNHLKAVEKEIANNLKEIITKEFEMAREMNSDIYGIGKDIRKFHPGYWKEQKDSYAYLQNVEFDIQIESNVRRSGLIIEPTQLKVKEGTK